MFVLRLDGEVELGREKRAFQVEKTAGTTNIEKKRVRMGATAGYVQGRGGAELLDPHSCKASCALGSLDSIFKARRF